MVTVDKELCKACGLCVSVCPKKVLHLNTNEINKHGFHPAGLFKEGCIGCASCGIICPEAAITVMKD